jgi:glycosyltransferase involved in cell wall biosynthesis
MSTTAPTMQRRTCVAHAGRRLRVLISAYACEPDRGSEPGAGWNWALAAARDHDVCVLTRENNRPVIEAALAADPQPSLSFVYIDLPGWARRWKRGGRGIRLYYALWQLLAARTARRLHREQPFDVVHHLTFANLWYPALVCLVKAPFVLGPVGGGPHVPLRLYPVLGVRGAASEALLVVMRALSRLNPLVRIAWRRADVILVQNEETRAALPRRARERAAIRPHASVPSLLLRPADGSVAGNVALFAGRLVPWKGALLALEAVARLPHWRLIVVGDGPDRRRLKERAAQLWLDGRLTFVPWLSQRELWQLAAGCRALVLSSLRDDAPLIAAEAQSLGVPVVAFDQGGPRVFARLSDTRFELAALGSHEDCVRGLAEALERSSGAGLASDAFRLEGVARDLGAAYRAARRRGRQRAEIQR